MSNLPLGIEYGDRVRVINLDSVSSHLASAIGRGKPLYMFSHSVLSDGNVLVATYSVGTTPLFGDVSGYVRAEHIRPWVDQDSACDDDPVARIREIADENGLEVTITEKRVTEPGALGITVEVAEIPDAVGYLAVVFRSPPPAVPTGVVDALILDGPRKGRRFYASLRPLKDNEKMLP